MFKDATISASGKYRYVLERSWGDHERFVLFIGLNPSTADATVDDQTVRRCVDFAQRWGYESMRMVNLFAYRAAKPTQLLFADRPIGVYNNMHIQAQVHDAHKTVACWGDSGRINKRNVQVTKLLRPQKLMCFVNLTKLGQPRHPLYMKKDASLRTLPSWERIDNDGRN